MLNHIIFECIMGAGGIVNMPHRHLLTQEVCNALAIRDKYVDEVPEQFVTEEFCLLTLEFHPNNISKILIPEYTPAICHKMIEKGLFHAVPSELITEPMCRAAIGVKCSNMWLVPDKFKTNELVQYYAYTMILRAGEM